jgi:hypothetical protein
MARTSLTDTGNNDAAPDDYTPEDLQDMANELATQLFVVEDRRRSCSRCGVRKWVSRTRLKFAFGAGIIVAIQAVGVVAVRAVVAAEVRRTVVEVLKEQRLLMADRLTNRHPLQFISQAHADERKSP